jgi:hypothetical protein
MLNVAHLDVAGPEFRFLEGNMGRASNARICFGFISAFGPSAPLPCLGAPIATRTGFPREGGRIG